MNSGFKKLGMLLWIALSISSWNMARAGGGGENLLLVVNPNDEPSLRIANAYIAARQIPACNVFYYAPPTIPGGLTPLELTLTQFTSTYVPAVTNVIASRGLINQIDYIGTLGQAHSVQSLGSVPAGLNHLTQLNNGMAASSINGRASELLQTNLLSNNTFNYTPGSNAAIHHSQIFTSMNLLSGSITSTQWYMSGMIGYSGGFGLSPSQVVQSLRRSVAADGTKPQGSIYFEDNNDVRSTTRAHYWPSVQSYMTAHGIPWVQQGNGTTLLPFTPANCRNIMGAEIGASGFTAPNGSNYMPGAWASSLTSFGGNYGSQAQTNIAVLIQSGCAATAGTVFEPMAVQKRFDLCDIWVFQHDGSTLGEAFYKSVGQPDYTLFQGDLLSQAFADIPQVTFTSAPANGSLVSGIVNLTATASLTNPQTATGVASLSLFVDGIKTALSGTGSSATFNWNTSTLTDGIHEVRVVAYNNSQAASEGCALLSLAVNNHGQSVSIGGTSSYKITWNQTLNLPVSAVQGSGPAITGIQLQSNGRVLGLVSGTSGTILLSGTQLAYDANPITPVALLTGSGQIQGMPIRVSRQFRALQGTPPTPKAQQNPGFDFYYYPGVGGNTLAATNFNGIPAYVGHSNFASITPADAVTPNMPNMLRGSNNAGLAVVVKGAFTVTEAGEYNFNGLFTYWTSAAILIDGVQINSYDCWNGSSFVTSIDVPNIQPFHWDTSGTVYLEPGEHTLMVQLVQKTATVNNSFSFYFRDLQPQGADGQPLIYMTIPAAGPQFYTIRK